MSPANRSTFDRTKAEKFTGTTPGTKQRHCHRAASRRIVIGKIRSLTDLRKGLFAAGNSHPP